VLIRIAALATILAVAQPSSSQTTLPGLGTRNTKPLPPVVVVQPQPPRESTTGRYSRVLADVQELLA